MESKNILFFRFWRKKIWKASSMKKVSYMSKVTNLSKPCFGCCLYRSLVNFKNLIVFRNIWLVYSSWNSWRSVVFHSEYAKKRFVIFEPNRLIRSPLQCIIFSQTNWRDKWRITCHIDSYPCNIILHQVTQNWNSKA